MSHTQQRQEQAKDVLSSSCQTASSVSNQDIRQDGKPAPPSPPLPKKGGKKVKGTGRGASSSSRRRKRKRKEKEKEREGKEEKQGREEKKVSQGRGSILEMETVPFDAGTGSL